MHAIPPPMVAANQMISARFMVDLNNRRRR
jgi:hypothetical protein